ncbi:hypothetical protein QAD02_009315 [Eretmocerus hayati]|uniref:Uncharacterized protein n=1 Tax=Eretmocerus hayati TaxID=131215 RepID=A0ACC2N922_9HYME|nr:hypothetical protein QAD02_009315 [Eretmocerus hayati]
MPAAERKRTSLRVWITQEAAEKNNKILENRKMVLEAPFLTDATPGPICEEEGLFINQALEPHFPGEAKRQIREKRADLRERIEQAVTEALEKQRAEATKHGGTQQGKEVLADDSNDGEEDAAPNPRSLGSQAGVEIVNNYDYVDADGCWLVKFIKAV